MLDLVVKNAKVIFVDGVYEAEIGIEDGKISKVCKVIDDSAERRLDASGKLVMAGGIDAHTHFQLKYDGTLTADDFYTGTVAAACGGITTIIDFITPERGESYIEAYEKRREEADGKAVIDYGLHLCVIDTSEDRLKELETLVKEHGVSTFKFFTAYRKRGLMLDDGSILELMRRCSGLGVMLLAHCENEDMINRNVEKFLSAGLYSPEYHAYSRPDYVEAEAIQRVAFISKLTNTPVLVVHLSSKMGLDAIRKARSEGVRIYAETCPHYLIFTDEVYKREDGAKWIMSPPLKKEHDRQALWKGIADGSIATAGSDHACFTYEQKKKGKKFTEIPGGVQGVENIIPILYSEGVRKGLISLGRLVEITSLNPAKLYGLYPRKGAVMVGSDADLVVIDPNRRVRLGVETLHSNLDHSIYEGIEVVGYPVHTISKGEVIVEDMEFVGKQGRGEYVKRGKHQSI